MQRSLVKYRIGLGVLGWLTLLIFIMVLAQAGATKQDTQTQKAANSIADKLDNYINDRQKVPSSLAAAGIKNVPPTISYAKKTNDIYQFCVTYKKSNNGFSALGVVQNLMAGGFGSASGDNTDGQGYYNGDSSTLYSSIYVNPAYHKGKNCQTVNSGVSSYNAQTQNTQTTQTQPPYVKNSDNTYTVCGIQAYFDTEGHITNDAATPGRIWLTSTYYPTAGSNILTVFSSTSEVFDQNCKPLTQSDLHSGDLVDLFSTITAAPPSASIYLKPAQ